MSAVIEIPLARGRGVARIDADDVALVAGYNWCAKSDSHTTYAQAYVHGSKVDGGQQRNVRMHRVILGITDPNVEVDHRDGDGLNNTRANLRVATRTQNLCNRRKQSGSSSRFKGVQPTRRGRPWRARIRIAGTRINLGSFDCEEYAARVYDAAAWVAFGEFARLNFPRTEVK